MLECSNQDVLTHREVKDERLTGYKDSKDMEMVMLTWLPEANKQIKQAKL